MRAAPRVQRRAAAALAVRIDERRDGADEAVMLEHLDDQRALPQPVFGQRPVLQRAAAAGAEMLARRRHALGARTIDVQKLASVGMAGDGLDRHRFAGQRVGHVDRSRWRLGDAVAAMPEGRDGELFGHSARLSRECRRAAMLAVNVARHALAPPA
ncbi:MAG TPA: hypothetical protein VLU41_10420 [Ideonella sp.]|nr:hypothetical protein [Ideonella sp.]